MKTLDAFLTELNALPARIRRAELAVIHASAAAIQAKEQLGDECAALRLARNSEGFSVIAGKNAEERDAQLRQMTAGLRARLIEAERELDKAQLELHEAQNTFSAFRATARVLGREAAE